MWRSCRKKKEGFKVQVASLPLGSRVVEPKCNFRRVSRARRVASHSIAYPQSSTNSDMAKQRKQNRYWLLWPSWQIANLDVCQNNKLLISPGFLRFFKVVGSAPIVRVFHVARVDRIEI